MAILTPPGWLVALSALCFIVFLAVAGPDIFGTEDIPSLDPTAIEVAFDFAGDLWTFVTFGFFDDSVQLWTWLKGVLFMVCTLPWFLVIASAIIEAVKAIGSFLPFGFTATAAVAAASLAFSAPVGGWSL